MDIRADRALLRALGQVAPGSPMRDGLDRVLQSGRGGLIVIGDGPDVLNICSGGFLLDAAFTPQRLSELAKMDGAIILASDGTRIARANVHLVPNPNVPTSETGTRHRTAERVARSLNVPVIAVSESRKEIQVYVGDQRHPLESVSRLLERSNQALQTLERYRNRLTRVSNELSVHEIDDLVTLNDVVEVLQRLEMVMRIANEIERNLIELGSDGRLVRLQLEELMGGVIDERRMLIRDYVVEGAGFSIEEAMDALSALDNETLFDPNALARVLHLPEDALDPDDTLSPRGHRLLNKLPRMTEPLTERVIERFGTLANIIKASPEELLEIEGMQAVRLGDAAEALARMVRANLNN